MKQFFASALLFTCLSFPASASSIELIDNMVTGPQGRSSIITLGGQEPCAETACVDATGGSTAMSTGSAPLQAALNAMPLKKINFDFARKFPDPAVPVVSAAPAEEQGSANPLAVPSAPADSGTIAAQPPVQPQPENPGATTAEAQPAGAPVDPSRGSIDPKAPVKPIVSSELREGE